MTDNNKPDTAVTLVETENTDDVDAAELEDLADEFTTINKEFEELSGTPTIQSASKLKEDKQEEEEQKIREQQETYHFYFYLPPEEDIDVTQIFSVFNHMAETVPGQLVISAYDLDSDKTITKYQPGKGIAITEDHKQFYAAVSGQLTWWGDVLSVEPIKRIKGDLDSSAGSLSIKGNLIVEGNIMGGIEINVKGDIYVFENIGDATVQAEGSIYVKNGIKGGGKEQITSKKNIFAKFIENATVSARNNVIVSDAIMHSNITAEGQVIVAGGLKSLIVGGTIISGEGVICNILGSDSYTKTEIFVGLLGYEKKNLDELRTKRNEIRDQQLRVDTEIGTLSKLKNEGKLDEDKEKKLKDFLKQKTFNKDVLKDIQSKINQIGKSMDSRKKGSVDIGELVYPGVKVTINKAAGSITKTTKKVRIYERKGELAFSTYDKPAIGHLITAGLDIEAVLDPPTVEECNFIRKSLVLEGKNKKEIEERARHLLRLDKDHIVSAMVSKREEEGKETILTYRIVEVKDGENKDAIKHKIVPLDLSKAVRVEGESVQDCLNKVSKLAKIPVNKLDYRIIQEKKAGVLGVGKKSCILKVFLKRQQDLIKSKVISNIGKDMDGYFTIQNTHDGLKLSIFAPKGDGNRIEESEIMKDLNIYGYDLNIDKSLISQTVENPNGIPVIIGPRQPEPELDGKFEVHIAEDKLSASVTVYPPEEEGLPITPEDIISDLEKREIKNINKEKIKNIFEEELWAEEIPIADGVPAKDGEDARIEFKISLDPKKNIKFEEDDSGKVDFHDMNLIENVTAGQVLAVKSPAVNGQDGVDIYGNIIESKQPDDVQLLAGKNVSISDDGMKLIADIDGHVMYDGKKIKVDPIYLVHGDVTYETGNITFLGSVVVTGAVRDDFIVRATGDVFVNHVAGAEIEAEGNIVIAGGVSGRDKAVLKAGQNVFAKFVEQATIKAGGIVSITDAIMHSNVSAGKSIVILEGKRGLIVGGVIRASEEIYAKEVGSKIATKTILEVGIDPVIRENIMQIEAELKEQHKNYEKVRKGIKALSSIKKKTGSLPEQKEALLLELVGVGRVLNSKLRNIQQELKSYQLKMRESEKGKVCIKDTLFTGVKITIRNATLHVDDEFKFVKFFYKDGEVKFDQYEEPSSKILEEIKHGVKEPHVF